MTGSSPPTLGELREAFHRDMHGGLFGQRSRGDAVPVVKSVQGSNYIVLTNADSHNSISVVLADGVARRLGVPPHLIGTQGSTLGSLFERHTRVFVERSMQLFTHLNERRYFVQAGGVISKYAQYEHLERIERLVRGTPELEAALGGDYLVAPDILVGYEPTEDAVLNAGGAGLDYTIAQQSIARGSWNALPILHASISCKWTMRRDRAQNTRLEALNLVRNRKGRLPHIVAVTMEADPEILASLCLGTGDIDCVYHGALHELLDAADEAASKHKGKEWQAKRGSLARMVEGRRLRDISDLPLDLLV